MLAMMDPNTAKAALDAYGTAAQGAQNNAQWLGQQIGGYQQPTFSTTLPTQSFNMGDRQQNLDQVITAASQPVMRQLQEQILPSIRSSALESGAYSGDRAMSVVPGSAIDAATRNMQDIATQLSYEDYNNWENRRLSAFQSDQDRLLAGYNADTSRGLGTAETSQNWLNSLPNLLQTQNAMQAGAGDLYAQMGGFDQANRQAEIDNALAKENYAIQRPFAGLDTAAGLYATLGGNYGTQTGNSTNKTVEKTGGLGSVVQGLAGLGMAGASLMGGGGLGGLLGGAGGAFTPGLTNMNGGLLNTALRPTGASLFQNMR